MSLSSSPVPSDREQWARSYGRAGEKFRASAIYQMRLGGPAPKRMLATPTERRPHDPLRGEAIMRGQWRFDNAYLPVRPDFAPWGPAFPSLHLADKIHRFGWLRDIIALGPSGAEHARALAMSWSSAFGKWDSFAWRIDVTAERIINWLIAGPYILEALEGEARRRMMECLGRQIRHLNASLDTYPLGLGRSRAATALSLAGIAMPDNDKLYKSGMESLLRESNEQILEDGGHISRCPQTLAETMIDMQMIEDLLLRVSRPVPEWMIRTQGRMAKMLDFLSMPGGGHFVCNGGDDGRNGLTRAALGPHGDIVPGFDFARLSGFHRVDSGELSVFMDTGPAPDNAHAQSAHAGCLAICVVDSGEQIITSCGANSNSSPDWREAARGTAGHSTLMLDNTQSAQFGAQDTTGIAIPVGPAHVSARRLEENAQFLLEAQHGGWLARYGLVYRRRLFITKNGNRIIGEDSLSRPVSQREGDYELQPIPYVIRFHLHPDVQVVMRPEHNCVYLGVENTGNVWRFRCDGNIEQDLSIYAAGDRRRRCSQLFISGEADPDGDGGSAPNRVRWALTRVAPGERL